MQNGSGRPSRPLPWVLPVGLCRCGDLRCRRVGRKGALGALDEGREGGGLVDGQVGQDATVDANAGQGEALDEAVVRQAVGAGRGVDPLDPQATEVALACTAVTVAVDEGVGDLLLGLTVQTRTLTAVTRGAFENDATLLVGVYSPLYSCHFSSSLRDTRSKDREAS